MQRHRVGTSEAHSHLSEPFRIHELADADERRLVSLRLPKDGCATVGIWDKHVCVAPLRSPSKVTFDVSCPSTQSLQTTHCRFFFIHSCPGSLTKNIKCKARTVRIQQYADSPRQKITTLMYYTVYFFFFSCPRPSLWAEASSMLEIIHIITELITGHYRAPDDHGQPQRVEEVCTFYACSMLIRSKIGDAEQISSYTLVFTRRQVRNVDL